MYVWTRDVVAGREKPRYLATCARDNRQSFSSSVPVGFVETREQRIVGREKEKERGKFQQQE